MSFEYGIISMPTSYSTYSNTWNLGWSFTANEGLKCAGIRLYYASASDINVFLWDASGNKIASGTISTSIGEWKELIFDSAVNLSAGSTYTVSAYSTGIRYTANSALFTFNPKITFISGKYGKSSTKMPTDSESYVYPIVDIIIEGVSAYKSSGNSMYTIENVGGYVENSIIEWDEETPEGTSVAVSVSIDGQNFTSVINGGQFIPPGSYEDASIQIRVDLATEDVSQTPSFSNLQISVSTAEDQCFLVLEFASGNQSSVQNAAGPITVAYNGTKLSGDGGFVQAFELECPIDGLAYKGGQNDAEHIEIASIQAHGKLTRLYYSDYSTDAGHLELGNITATGVLIHVNDI